MKSIYELFPEEEEKIRGETRTLMMTLPSIAQAGEQFSLKAVMMAISGMPDEGFRGVAHLRPSGPGLEVPDRIEFGPRDHGRLVLPELRADDPGVYFVEAEVEGSPSPPPRSNPVRVQEEVSTRLFWGDIHFHTIFSNCHRDWAKDPAFGYWYAKEVAHLDFAAGTDHLRGLDSDRWKRTKQIVSEHNQPGEFVSVLGFESSHSKAHGGDINVYYGEGEAEYFWLDREDMKGINPKVGLDVLWDWLDDRGVPYVTLPHHTGRAAKYRDFDLPYYNAQREPVMEIFSWWGSSEARHDGFFLNGGKTDSRAYFQDALDLGYRYGVIGSSDNHHTMPGTPYSVLPTAYHHPPNKMASQGLAAVYASELTRESIFNALASRNCYATTSTRPILSFSVNGTPMGQTLAGDNAPRRISVDLCTSRLPATIEVLRNNEVIETRKAEDPHTVHRFVDDADPCQLWIKDAPKNPRPFLHYYARVRYAGFYYGITAWSSPVWVQGT
jgi:hypothetical protein